MKERKESMILPGILARVTRQMLPYANEGNKQEERFENRQHIPDWMISLGSRNVQPSFLGEDALSLIHSVL